MPVEAEFRKRVTINLAPADVRKEGSGFDLPMALGLWVARDSFSANNWTR